MSDALRIAVAALCGLVAGGAFFGGLWISTMRLARAQANHRISLALGSFVLRGAAAIGLAVVSALLAGHWGALAFLIAFTAVRLVLITLVRRKNDDNA